MKVGSGSIWKTLEGDKQFVVPMYQRPDQWEIEDCERLWKDMVAMQRQGRPSHFIGSMVSIAYEAPSTGLTKYTVIDGQQRLTTVTLLLLAILDHAARSPGCGLKTGPIESRLRNRDADGDEQYKLLLTQPDRRVLQNLVDRIQGNADDASSHAVRRNYDFFRSRVASEELPLEKVVDAVGRLQLVDITLDSVHDDAQAIFESLNSTGKDLSETDLIRNYVLMNLMPDAQRDTYSRSWRPMEELFPYAKRQADMDQFFRAYLTMVNGKIPRKDRVYAEFKRYAADRVADTDARTAMARELYEDAVHFTSVLYARSNDPELDALYQDVRELKMEPADGLLLRLHVDHAASIIDSRQLKELLSIIISYVLRRSVCGMPANGLNKTLLSVVGAIREEDYVNSVKAGFVLRKSAQRFPSDEEFIHNFETSEIGKMPQVKYILRRLEQYENKNPFKTDGYTLEHILPQGERLPEAWQQALGPDWKAKHENLKHVIGNLTFSAYNSEGSW